MVLGKKARKSKAGMQIMPSGLDRTKSVVVCGTWQGRGRRTMLEKKSKSLCSALQGTGPKEPEDQKGK